MDVLTSTEFRKRYASLAKPTKVTVSGHTIGVWTPGGTNPNYDDIPDVFEQAIEKWERFNTRPFTPVPKRHG